jgi:hypothetical protein
MKDIAAKFGSDAHSVRGNGFAVLEFGDDTTDHSDLGYEWVFYFDMPSAAMVSATHNSVAGASIKSYFPPTETRVHVYKNGSSTMSAISRILPGDRVLIAVGVANPESQCSQMVLIRRSALKRFYPWIAKDLE